MEAQNLNKKLDKICKKGKAVGVNLALFDGKGIIYNYNYGFANKEQGIKSNNDSLYMIGSNTKVLTALGILKLMEEGKLSLEDDIKKHIPEFEVQSHFEYDKITIANLLMHRSGLVSDLFHLILDKTRDYHEVIPELRETYLTATPGKMFSYSNVGYTVLGVVIERVSGLSYTKYIQQEIAKPLGIQVHFLSNEEERHPFVSTVSLSYDKKGNVMEDNLATLLPAGSNTYMSLSDFIKFGQMFLKKDGVLLKKETLEFMETLDLEDSIDREVYNVGFGLIHKQYDMGEQVGKVLGHGGNTTCHHSMFNYIPQLNVGIVVMTNSQSAIGFYATAGMTVLMEYLKEKGIAVEERKTEQERVKCDSDDMIGKYATARGVMEIKRNNKNELVTKVSKIPIQLSLCKDGYYQCMPVKAIHKIPIFRRSIQGMRLKPATYLGEDIMLIEQAGKYHKTRGIIGCKYEQTDIPVHFRKACGNYMVADEIFKELKCKCQLKVEGDVLTLEIEALNVKLNNCLKVVGEDLAILQGFGRLAKEAVKLKKEDSGYYLTFSGIVFKKME
ncbi:MAG: beta-lactamase family protein [Lachnospiraceae bacterium]|nr:beta-lactamase family protein [Lachnospiraceae bacterium]